MRIASRVLLLCLLGVFGLLNVSRGQTVSINLRHPRPETRTGDGALYVAAAVTSTYQLQSVVAAVQNRTTNMVYSSSVYTNCFNSFCDPMPGWSNIVTVMGMVQGSNWVTVTAVDVFGNSNQVGRSFVYDQPPTMTVTAPPHGFVQRTSVPISVQASDTNPDWAYIEVYQDNIWDPPLLAVGTNSLNTSIVLTGPDGGGPVTLVFRALDQAGAGVYERRQVYLHSSSNLVEVAHVSGGWIKDVQPDRLLFTDIHGTVPKDWTFGEGVDHDLFVKSRTNGAEQLVFFRTNLAIHYAFLGPKGPMLLGSAVPFESYSYGVGIFQKFEDAEIRWGRQSSFSMFLNVKGNFALWGGHEPKRLELIDLRGTNSVVITNGGEASLTYDLAANGDVVFSLYKTSYLPFNGVYRYRNGLTELLASNPNTDYTNEFTAAKTDGTNVYYIKIVGPTQSLIKIANGAETVLAQSSEIDPNYLLENGWLAHTKVSAGVRQIWRRSPGGENTQLTFSGTPSTLLALAPNGEVAFYNGTKLYISKGAWPPQQITNFDPLFAGLKVFWQEGRWWATQGRSLFQIYTGTPSMVLGYGGSGFKFDVVGAKGQRLVTEFSTNYVNWTPVATNDIVDNGNLTVETPIDLASPGKVYRLRTQ